MQEFLKRQQPGQAIPCPAVSLGGGALSGSRPSCLRLPLHSSALPPPSHLPYPSIHILSPSVSRAWGITKLSPLTVGWLCPHHKMYGLIHALWMFNCKEWTWSLSSSAAMRAEAHACLLTLTWLLRLTSDMPLRGLNSLSPTAITGGAPVKHRKAVLNVLAQCS